MELFHLLRIVIVGSALRLLSLVRQLVERLLVVGELLQNLLVVLALQRGQKLEFVDHREKRLVVILLQLRVEETTHEDRKKNATPVTSSCCRLTWYRAVSADKIAKSRSSRADCSFLSISQSTRELPFKKFPIARMSSMR